MFDVLEHLIGNRERVVSKDDRLAAVWNGRIVSPEVPRAYLHDRFIDATPELFAAKKAATFPAAASRFELKLAWRQLIRPGTQRGPVKTGDPRAIGDAVLFGQSASLDRAEAPSTPHSCCRRHPPYAIQLPRPAALEGLRASAASMGSAVIARRAATSCPQLWRSRCRRLQIRRLELGTNRDR
jgi:hypothetical protein